MPEFRRDHTLLWFPRIDPIIVYYRLL